MYLVMLLLFQIYSILLSYKASAANIFKPLTISVIAKIFSFQRSLEDSHENPRQPEAFPMHCVQPRL